MIALTPVLNSVLPDDKEASADGEVSTDVILHHPPNSDLDIPAGQNNIVVYVQETLYPQVVQALQSQAKTLLEVCFHSVSEGFRTTQYKNSHLFFNYGKTRVVIASHHLMPADLVNKEP